MNEFSDKNNNVSFHDRIPLGLGMALAQNTRAMIYFSALKNDEQMKVIERSKAVNSKDEMHLLVDRLSKNDLSFLN